MLPRGIAIEEREIQHIARDDRARANQRIAPDCDAAQERRVGADARALADDGARIFSMINFCARKKIIRKRDVRSDKNAVLDRKSLPQRDAIFYYHIIADDYAAFDKAVVADVAIRANHRAFQHMRESPNARVIANGFAFDERGGMFKVIHVGVLVFAAQSFATRALRTRP